MVFLESRIVASKSLLSSRTTKKYAFVVSRVKFVILWA